MAGHLESAAQPGRSGPYHSYFFVHDFLPQLLVLQSVTDSVIPDEPLKASYIDGMPVFLGPIAFVFTRMGANPAADSRKGSGLTCFVPGKLTGFLKGTLFQLCLLNRGQPGTDIITGRTSCGAGRYLPHICGALVTVIAKGNDLLESLFFDEWRKLPVQNSIKNNIRLIGFPGHINLLPAPLHSETNVR